MAALVAVAGTANFGHELESVGPAEQGGESRWFPAILRAPKPERIASAHSGHRCFTKGEGKAQCNKTCTAGVKGFTCDVINPHSVPVAMPLGQSLYCFSEYTENTGNESLVSHELELLNIVAARGAGIFACEQWDVFGDVSVPLVNGYVTSKLHDHFGEFHQLKRKDSGTWVNWGIFYQAWVKIREVGKWNTADYTIKVDADAVFVP